MRVYCGGNFDLFHSGHVNFLRQCSKHGSVTVALNRDDFAARYKRHTVMRLPERIEVVRACRYVDAVVVNETDEDARPTILRVKPNAIAHGDDWTGQTLMKQLGITQKWLDKHGIRMLYVPYTRGVSTTDLIERAQAL